MDNYFINILQRTKAALEKILNQKAIQIKLKVSLNKKYSAIIKRQEQLIYQTRQIYGERANNMRNNKCNKGASHPAEYNIQNI